MYGGTTRVVAQPLMAFVAIGNLMLYFGWRRPEGNRKGALAWIGLALFLPLLLEILPLLFAMKFAEPPRRYQYYSEQPTTLLAFLGQPGWTGHTISLVFLFFGLVIRSILNRDQEVGSRDL